MFDLATKYCFHLDKDNAKSLELFLLLYSLEKYVNGAIIEMNRLEKTRKNITKKLLNLKQNISTPRKRDFWLTYLSCDTHFYFICIDKCYKLITQLAIELKDKEINKLKIRLNKVFDIATIRNHLEHIEDRCKGYLNLKDKRQNIKKHISDFGNFAGDDFSFNNKKYPTGKRSLKELKNIYLELIKILDKKARKDPKFVEKVKMEERNKLIMKALKKAGLIKNLPLKRKISYDFPCGLPPAKNLKSSFSLPLSGEAGGKGVWGEFRPPSPLMKSVRIFSNTYRQLVKEFSGSPATRARQPILKQKFNFLSLFRKTER